MKIAVGSTREPKVKAVREAWEVFGSKLLEDSDEKIIFTSYDMSNNSSEMPLDIAALMNGARNRTENLILQLKREKSEVDFYIGLESGFNVMDPEGPHRRAFVENWAYVSDGYKGYFGHSGGLYVPSFIADPVIDRGIELGIVMDRITNQSDVGNGRGAWGILTHNMMTRQSAFVVALIAAFAPFYNPEAYQ
ncbi:MAG: inosine/xanthosine triphosphatase [Acidobacteriota bacterium]|nr:inosine/xanthosine triphosphatase [Acidobacteriota bacterium]